MQTSQRLTVTVVNEVEVISAYDMATQLGIEYRALKSTIAKHLTQIEKEFGRVSFQMMPLQTKGGVQTVNVCWLTEEQAYFVTTLSKNTSIVMQCKAAVVKAFMAYRQGVSPQMTLDLQPVETIRVIPNELYEELMGIESKPKRMKLMKLYKAIAAKGQTL